MPELDLDKARRDFELSMLFNNFNLPSYAGVLQRKPDGLYTDNHIEAAFRGYCMAQANCKGQLERFDPDREIPTGMITRFRELMLGEADGMDAKNLFAAIMKVLADSPN